jgi:hypothetical protein
MGRCNCTWKGPLDDTCCKLDQFYDLGPNGNQHRLLAAARFLTQWHLIAAFAFIEPTVIPIKTRFVNTQYLQVTQDLKAFSASAHVTDDPGSGTGEPGLAVRLSSAAPRAVLVREISRPVHN